MAARVELTPVATARAAANVNPITRTAFTADGIKFKNKGKEFIMVERAVAQTSTITIATHVTEDGLTLPNVTHTMAAGDSTVQTKMIGPFPKEDYNQTDGFVYVDSDSTDDTIAVFSLEAVS